MYSITIYVPESALQQVKDAAFAAGAGRYKNYDCCCWQTLGTGQFRALAGANPTIGEVGFIERVSEYKVEMICDAGHVNAVITAIKSAHPYEEPAFKIVKMQQFNL